MTYNIHNSFLTLSVKSAGAEISSLVSKPHSIEYMWQADPEIWGRHAPVLFPIVGRLKNDQYTYEGKSYTMKQHGFARNNEFELVSQAEDQLHFRLLPNDDIRKMYPFDFQMDIMYQLFQEEHEHGVKITYQIHNMGETTMPFSIGGHPGFSCPMVAGEELTDYDVVFEEKENLERHLLEGGLYNGETSPLLENEQIIPITPTLFDQDALVVHSPKSDIVSLVSRKSGHKLTVDISAFDYLGIWAKPGAPFVCIEPWLGLADYTDATGDIMEKTGVHLLLAGKRHTCSYAFKFANPS